MATIPPSSTVILDGMRAVSWTALATGDDGTPEQSAHFADRSVQVFGTFAAGTVIIEGSNEATPTTWATLTDPAGLPISFTAAGLKQVVENARHIRPRVTGGAASGMSVILVARR
jgi:hypothetical protein